MQEIRFQCSPEEAKNDDFLRKKIKSILKLDQSADLYFEWHKRSIDARKKKVKINCVFQVSTKKPLTEDKHMEFKPVNSANIVHIIGMGPAGMFAALQAIKSGYKPIIYERGKNVRERRRDLAKLNKEGIVNPESNYCFGEGGAGTYSDGKLYTRSKKRGDVKEILKLLVQFGAHKDILVDAHPHIGTNKLPQIISFAKVRASAATVGNEVPFNRISPANTITASGGVNRNTQKPFTDLKPEMIETTELGLDIRFLNNKIGLDLAYYNITSTDQFLSLAAPSGSGYTRYFVNAGEIVNDGVEISITGKIIEKENLTWSSVLNYTKNNNEVVSIHPDLAGLGTGGGDAVQSRFVPGGSIGDMYVWMHRRDAQGRILLSADGVPLASPDREFAGNAEPDYSIGWSNNFTFGDRFTAGFIINGKFGGTVYSHTETMLNGFGVSARTAEARDAGSVSVNAALEDGTAVSSVDPVKWYQSQGDRNGIAEAYLYDRTNIRLTQLSLGYNIDTESLGLPLDSASLSLIGNNLFYTAEAPFDPELAMSTSRNNQGIHNFNLPSTRTIGMNLRLTF